MANSSRKAGRTLVEFYDSEYLENVVALLCGDYTAVTYVYFRHANEPDLADRQRLLAFIQERFGFAPRFLEIPETSMDAALTSFRRLAAESPCDFDITGGSSLFIAAAGALLAELGRERVWIHEYDVPAGRRKFCFPVDAHNDTQRGPNPLTVSEVMALRGVRMLDSETPIRYAMNTELRGEIIRLWEAVRSQLRAWNSFSVLPAEYTQTWSGLLVEKRMDSRQYSGMQPLLDNLSRAKILSDRNTWVKGGQTFLSFRLNVPDAAFVLYQKGGNLLELLTCLAVEDSGRFHDCCTGVKLDWDDRGARGYVDPFNELDVVMTKGHIPYFVSCKNTAVENDYLYEIMTMTRHFGGAYAVPVLVSSAENGSALHVRAEEMGIVLLDGVGGLTAAQFTKKLHHALCEAQSGN